MSAIDKWADRVYAETDFGRGVATSLAGVVGLAVYLSVGDWVIAAFSAIISFPVFRIAAAAIHSRFTRGSTRRAVIRNADIAFAALTRDEKDVVREFVRAGGCVLTWSQMNKTAVAGSSIESLIQRGLLSTSVTADGMRETFVLETSLFDAGVRDGAKHAA